MAGLTHLELRNRGRQTSPIPWRTILAVNANLETLVIDNMGDMGVEQIWPSDEVLTLPFLRTVVILGQREDETSAFMRRLYLPSLTDFNGIAAQVWRQGLHLTYNS